jgi:3-phenylpropionate/cinnamic acid dioxygenase small subunit
MEALDDVGKALGEDQVVSASSTPVPVGSDRYGRVVEWLYREAALLDAADYSGWLDLLAEDLVYEMPTRQSVYQKDGDGFRQDFSFFSEDYGSMKTRVLRLKTDQAWAEQPGSRTRHYVSNVLVAQNGNDEYDVNCAFLVMRTRSDLPYDFFSGERRDVLRAHGNGFRLARRKVLIDQTILKSYNLSVFF